MGGIIRRPFRSFNGTDWDKHYFENEAAQVKFTKEDGTETTVQDELTELNDNLSFIQHGKATQVLEVAGESSSTYHIAFPSAFKLPPTVVATIGSANSGEISVINVNETGFEALITNRGKLPYTYSISWAAFGSK